MVPNLGRRRSAAAGPTMGAVAIGRPGPSAGSGRPPGWRRALALLAACHPEPAALVIILTSLLALAAGVGLRTLVLAAAVGAGQLGVGWSNDYLDRELDRAAGRRDKPLASAGSAGSVAVGPRAVRAAAILALLAAAPLSLVVSAGFAAAHLAAVACALAYNAGLKARPISVLPYAVAFGLLPAAVALATPAPHCPAAWAVAASALAGAGGHFTQALPDIPQDRALGIRGLPQVLGQRASALAAAALLLAANLTIAAAAETTGLAVLHAALATGAAVAIVVATLRRRERLAFRLTLATATLAVLAFLASGSRL
jgi:4-hydroxybenzoate polyprenyltransferase